MATRLELKADTEELVRLAEVVAGLAGGLDSAVAGRMMVVLNEVVTNVIRHGRLPPDATIGVELDLEGADLVATVDDPGPAFDPLASPPAVDPALPLDDRPIGGLGLFLARRLARELTYRREHGHNRLTVRVA